MREDDFVRVRQLRLDRLRQLRDLPPALAERAFLRMVYGTHPYGHLAIGTEASLRALSLDDVAGFHRAVYRPGRATLVVVGDLSHQEMLAVVERAFGEWEPGDAGVPGPPPAGPEREASAGRLAVIPRERAAQSHLKIGHLAPPRSTPDYSSLLVLNAVLGGQFVSRVNLKLREEKGYTYGARTGFDWHRGTSLFSLEASVDTAVTVDAVADALEELDAIRGRKPVTTQELDLARATLTRGYPRNFETAQQVARSVAQLVLYGLPDTYFQDFVPRVNAIAPDDLTRAAERYLDPTRWRTLIVGDRLAIDARLGELGLGEPETLAAEV